MKVFSKLHSERYESVCHSVTRGAIHCECGLPESLQWVYKAAVRQTVAWKDFTSEGKKKQIMLCIISFALHNL